MGPSRPAPLLSTPRSLLASHTISLAYPAAFPACADAPALCSASPPVRSTAFPVCSAVSPLCSHSPRLLFCSLHASPLCSAVSPVCSAASPLCSSVSPLCSHSPRLLFCSSHASPSWALGPFCQIFCLSVDPSPIFQFLVAFCVIFPVFYHKNT